MKIKTLLVLSVTAFCFAAAPALVIPTPHTAHAAEKPGQKEAKELVEQLGTEAVELLANDTISAAEQREAFDKLISRDFNMKLIGRFVLGKHWRKATKDQQVEYQALFKRYIISTYQKRIGEYSGENLKIIRAKPLNKKEFLVLSQIIRPSGPPIKLDWRVRKGKKNGQKIVDIIVENVSMAITHRDEFSSVISQNGGQVEGLLARLRKQIASAEK
ncbi:MAG: ABC transporter substrate-binding protein [Sneathiellales bacterium]|nr:ABC transporter substrate-binding protein [Sneathiellales bacterium]